MVQNVTTALNCVLKSQRLEGGDVIFSLDCEYGANKKMINQLCTESGAVSQVEVLRFPIQSKTQILELFETKLKPATKLILFDHIPSNTPFIMPVKEIVEICRRKCPGARIIVDGAHGLLGLPLMVSELGVDYYLTNCHKWFSAPKGL